MNAARNVIDQKLGRIEFTLMLSMTMALGALAIDMILPAMGDLRGAFDLPSDSNDVAAVITFFLLGLSFGQLLWGPLADVMGRKPVLYIGLTIYIAIATFPSQNLAGLSMSQAFELTIKGKQ